MANKDRLQKAGDYELDGVLIVGTSGARIAVTEQVRELNIYQSIDTPFMSGNLILADAQGVGELLPFIGQERMMFSLRTPGHNGVVDFNEYHAIIYNVERRFATTDREQSILLNWTTLENYKNVRIKISASFSGNISDIVEEILKKEEYIGTKKPINIEPTFNIKKYVIPNLNPFAAIDLLRVEAISKKEPGAPHFLFYENPKGFHFRSLDSLIGEHKTTSKQHKNTYRSQPPATGPNAGSPEASLGTILHWEVDDNSNSYLSTRLGMFASTLYTHDIFNKNIQKFEFDYLKDGFAKRNSTNQEYKNSGSNVSEAKVDGKKLITEFPESRIYVHSTASEKLYTSGKSDNNVEQWLQESESRSLEREYFTLKIDTHGDTNIMAGDMIEVLIPTNRPLDKTGGKTQMDSFLSGRYLITNLRHMILPTESSHAMYLTVMKDSVESKPPVRNMQYAEEPSGRIDRSLSSDHHAMKMRTVSLEGPEAA
tara:strand:+ start:1369 stop:2817 length:1449 start_codon:yes stop_codon:yes gene_type:complete